MIKESEAMISAVPFQILDEYFDQVVTPNFNIKGGGTSWTRDWGSDILNGSIKLPSSFISYKHSDYYEDPTNQKFVHFTSLGTFFKIINSGYFLATQFSNHDDPLELLFAGNELKEVIKKGSLDDLKKYIFSLSMCKYPFENESFDMWRMYGDKGRGIGIVFSFYQNSILWHNTFLSKVYYGNEKNKHEEYCLDKFYKFQTAHLNFLNSHPKLKMKKNHSGEEGMGDTLALFLAFHKNPLFEIETEVRFLRSFLSEGIKVKDESIELLLNGQREEVLAYRIPILSRDNLLKRKNAQLAKKEERDGVGSVKGVFPPGASQLDKILNEDPFIIIEKVILGYNYTQVNLQKFKKLEMDINSKIGYADISLGNYKQICFELTLLSGQYHGQ